MNKDGKTLIITKQEPSHPHITSSDGLTVFSTMAITVGTAGIFSALGQIPVFFLPLIMAAFTSAAILVIDFAAKGRFYGTMLCLLATMSLFFLSLSSVIRGIYAWINHFLFMWNQVFSTFYEEFPLSGYTLADSQTAELIFVLLTAIAVCTLVQKKHLALLTLITFAPLCLAMIFNIRLPLWIPAVLIMGWFSLWCAFSGPCGIRWEMILLIGGTGLILWSFPSEYSNMSWQRLARQFRTYAATQTEIFRFGQDSLPKGNLTVADRMLDGSQARLELQMEPLSPVYLRGFVGSVYEDSRWKPFQAGAYGGQYSGLLTWLARENFYPGAQYRNYRYSSSEENGNGEISVAVQNTGACRRYVYLPETVSFYENIKGTWKQDWSMETVRLFGQGDYEFSYFNTQINAENQRPDSRFYDDKTEQFLRSEQVYRAFVYDHYLDLDQNEKELIDSIFFQGMSQNDGEGLYTITSRVRTVLRVLAEYQKLPARVPANRDFLEWFLKEAKEGNSAYFATAAVLAYRAAGIPARYVEGYILTKDQAEQTDGDQVTLSTQNAHAWAEVYVDGMGWRTVEVTPGFYEELYEAEIIVAVPSDDIEGGSGSTAVILSLEEYELSDQEKEEPSPVQNQPVTFGVLPMILMILLILILLMAITCHARRLCLEYRYRNMSGEEKMYFLYGRIIDMMGKLYKNFNPDHPLTLPDPEHALFDTALYERTVKRMEKIIYGQLSPAPREIPSTEALTIQIHAALKKQRRNRIRKRFKRSSL